MLAVMPQYGSALFDFTGETMAGSDILSLGKAYACDCHGRARTLHDPAADTTPEAVLKRQYADSCGVPLDEENAR